MVNLNLFVAVCTRVDTWWFLFPVKRWVEAAWNSWLYDPVLDHFFWNELNGDLLCFKLYFSACHCFFGKSGRMCLFFDKDTKLFYHIDSLLKSCLITLFVLYSVSHNHGCSFDLARNSHGIWVYSHFITPSLSLLKTFKKNCEGNLSVLAQC